ncbi:hypothetical protein A2954_05925 [Candidatus Roizmanbacteria bacterium RIFCSPLOWO2_01_FULL_37_12]|uniref:Type 4 fimbrial biogenesis protein PilX N-terminal domain-containing protein n=1 Tax=Candidatus Roizmanbacteria bacterium RIFCSPLOWO2_01_FULL_37_12 TaxID=1802056 RepID=A0A1F7IBW0_9BACT|nr:MAG: hypothetical protein A2768_02665 [Candidatus Roizmanbacteria bacterium RIFCSPHIGHO2_01_FULL_37_16]OGK40844.1 MAG: hypothetical protein A2954_05925 [Candidatus Roizmanbacteria bacterium RIFCSPLOWO2_01_FULL_37_12]
MSKQRGQILLITIMLVATILTVVLAVTFKSTTETQLTELEEESQKALAAAEAGVEAALQQDIGGSVNIASLPNLSGSGFTGDATVGTIADSKFVSPLLQKDQQYTFYLSEYPGFLNPLTGVPLAIYFMTEGSCPTLELTFITPANVITRRVADPCEQIDPPGDDLSSTSGIYPLGGYNFSYQTDPVSADGYAVLIVRTLFASTRIALERPDLQDLPIQGKYVTSEAKSASGVTKKVQLFQSFPQIPAEFFVTSF